MERNISSTSFIDSIQVIITTASEIMQIETVVARISWFVKYSEKMNSLLTNRNQYLLPVKYKKEQCIA